MKNFEFDLCIPTEILIDFIDSNTKWEWNDICKMEYEYRTNSDFDNPKAYPMVNLGEEDPTTIQFWVEQFLETYKEKIENKQVYVIF